MNETRKRQNYNAFWLLSIFICLIYSNTLNSSWHFDDEPNILLNPYLHLTDMHFKSLRNTLISQSAESEHPNFYRPVSCFTFALNWYIGQDNTTGYHIINIAIHIITSFFLFLVVRQLTAKFDISNTGSAKHYFIALLSASLWAAAPIQTQAVTYIVQRMAAMAAMFAIFSIYSYIKWRTSETEIRIIWLLFSILFFFLGVGSKENAVMIFPSILLIEFSFFTHKLSIPKKIGIFLVCCFALSVILLISYFGFGKNPLGIFGGYSHRSFTLSERILTEPRILLMYLSQIFFPLVERLSIVHDIDTSKSFFVPWTTLPAISTCFVLIFISFFCIKKYSIVAFPILFFFLNHAVESTVLQLELIFEHRNYLPSFFIFFPVSFLAANVFFNSRKIFSFALRMIVFIGIVCFLIVSGYATYIRNSVWDTEETLWKDGIKKAPLNPRASYFLGRWLQETNRYNEAWHYFQHALQHSDRSPDNPKSTKIGALSALGSIPYQLERYEEALPYLDECFELEKDNAYNLKNRAMTYLHLGLPKKALNDAERLVSYYPDDPVYQYTAALAAYHAGDLAASQKYMKNGLRESLDKPYALHLIGLILFRYKNYPASLFFLQQAGSLSPETPEYKISLAIAYHANNNHILAESVVDDLMRQYPLPQIEEALHKMEYSNIDQVFVDYIFDAVNSRIGIIDFS